MLIAGTIAAFLPSSSFTKEVHALSEYELMKRDDYNSKYVQYNKENIDCTNFNLNGNGLDINTIPESLSGLTAASQGEIGDSESGTSAYGTEENRFGSYDSNKKDFLYKCINNNNNELIVSPTPSTPQPTPVDNVCTVWQDFTPGNYDIFFARSTDGGLTFSEPENISESPTNSLEPQVICEGNNVYVVWFEDITGTPGTPGVTDIFFARSTDGGLTFSEPENISENAGGSFLPQISSEGNNVYVVWQNDTPDNDDIFDIFFARSTNGGLTFSEPENISENTGDSRSPQISSNIELEQQSTNDIITTTANNNNDHNVIKNMMEQKEQKQIEEKQKIQTNNIIQPKDITTKDTTAKNVIEQKEEQKLAEEQKVQKSNVMSPPSLP